MKLSLSGMGIEQVVNAIEQVGALLMSSALLGFSAKLSPGQEIMNA